MTTIKSVSERNRSSARRVRKLSRNLCLRLFLRPESPPQSVNVLEALTRSTSLRLTSWSALKRHLRSTTTTTTLDVNPKGIDEIPSPKGLPFLGTTLSLIMAGSMPKLHRYIDKRHKQLGPIFKESVGPVPCVFISDPDAMRLIFAHEGKYPVHLLPEAWTTYNTLHNVSRGLFFMNGAEWLHFRRILNPVLLKGDQPWLESSCIPAVERLVGQIEAFTKSENAYPKMEELLYRWSLEVIVSTLVGPDNYVKAQSVLDKKIGQLASTIHVVFETSSKLALISSSFASKYNISRWKNFEASVTLALKSAADLVEVLSNDYVIDDVGLLGKLRGQMTANELAKIVTDLILAAGDTTAYAMEWLLYLVGKHSDVQEKLRKELDGGQKPAMNVVYLKHIVKEALRLYPVAPFLTRILPEPVKVNVYNIPAGTILILSIFTTGRDERNFQNPLAFDPDRWARQEIRLSGGIAQSAALPFAIGARSCIGRKLAEAQLQLTLAAIVRKFTFTVVNRKDIDVVLKMVAVPSEEIKFKFTALK